MEKMDADSIAVGVDVGGSHISSAAVNMKTNKLITKTWFHGAVDSKAKKEVILRRWAEIINKTLAGIDANKLVRIGFAMPGPFQYNTGTAMFKKNNKYEALYRVSVASELKKYLITKNVSFQFSNDASAFGVGGALLGKIKSKGKFISLTLGTGFGASFIENYSPIFNGINIPEGGCLWDKPFRDGIVDDYFSTRWFTSKYESLTGIKMKGVKEIVADEILSRQIFNEFAVNFANFMLPYIKTFEPEQLIIGGNITKSHHMFLPQVIQKWSEESLKIPVALIENTEEASIIGASYLFNKKNNEGIKTDFLHFDLPNNQR